MKLKTKIEQKSNTLTVESRLKKHSGAFIYYLSLMKVIIIAAFPSETYIAASVVKREKSS